jgi:aminodeoxychorismate synthase component I
MTPLAITNKPAAEVLQPARWHILESIELPRDFWQYFELFRRRPHAFLLDSALASSRLSRFSFIGADPFLVFRAKRHPTGALDAPATVEVVRSGPKRSTETRKVRGRSVFDVVQELMERHQVDHGFYERSPMPLMGGAVGYFGYEAGSFVEELPDTSADDLGLPDIQLMFCDVVLGQCHQTKKIYLSVVGRGASDNSARRAAIGLRDDLLKRIERFERFEPAARSGIEAAARPVDTSGIEIHRDFDEAGYCRAVEQIKEHIFAGDVYQACMSHRLASPLIGGDTWRLYRELRGINPAPFACFLKFPDVEVISTSPERFLSLSPDRIAESRPIKGTRPRGAVPTTDAALRDELRTSIKDRAENVMIVDLVRNDLGRVCEFGSVCVPELMTIEEYATVFQMVSTVRGKLPEAVHPVELVKSCFPGGSMTGAPKIEAMKIIDRLEPVKRGIYSGAIGYLDFAGPLDLNIVIRTFVVKDGWCYYNVGGAVVADSEPRAEYQETMDKAKALVQALAVMKRETE